jgi:hypothetical protein
VPRGTKREGDKILATKKSERGGDALKKNKICLFKKKEKRLEKKNV